MSDPNVPYKVVNSNFPFTNKPKQGLLLHQLCARPHFGS